MAELGQIGGLNYRMTFPSQAYGGGEAVPTQQQITAPTLPDADDPLANRRALTARYYDAYAALQNIVKDASAQGIDPFKPDYSQAGGGLAHQAFQEAQANLMYAANALKGEFQMQKTIQPHEVSGQTRMKQGANRDGLVYSDSSNFMPTAIDPIVTEANKALGDSRYTQSDSNRLNQAVRDPRVKFFQEQITKDPQNAEYYNRQIEALLTNAPQVYAPAAFDRDSGSNKQPKYLALHKQLTNFTRGAWAPGTYTTGVVRGKTYEINPENSGIKFGKGEITDRTGKVVRTVDKVLKQALKDENGHVYYQYQDPELPLERVDHLPPNQVVSRHIASDDAFGGSAGIAVYLNELDQAGLIDTNSRQANPQGVFGEQAPQLAQQSKPKFTTDRELAHIKEQYNRLVNGEGGFNTLTFTAPNGQVIKFRYDTNTDDSKEEGVYISNWKELGMNKENRKMNLSMDDVLQVMDDYGFWKDILDKKKQGGSQQSATPDNLTATQQKALVQFRIKFKRDPNDSELQKLLTKFK